MRKKTTYKHQKAQSRETDQKIMDILMKSGKRFNEIERESGMSSSLINDHLKKLMEKGIIEKYYDKNDDSLKYCIVLEPALSFLKDSAEELKKEYDKMHETVAVMDKVPKQVTYSTVGWRTLLKNGVKYSETSKKKKK